MENYLKNVRKTLILNWPNWGKLKYDISATQIAAFVV